MNIWYRWRFLPQILKHLARSILSSVWCSCPVPHLQLWWKWQTSLFFVHGRNCKNWWGIRYLLTSLLKTQSNNRECKNPHVLLFQWRLPVLRWRHFVQLGQFVEGAHMSRGPGISDHYCLTAWRTLTAAGHVAPVQRWHMVLITVFTAERVHLVLLYRGLIPSWYFGTFAESSQNRRL